MGHKVHPTIYRTPLIYTWDSKWFAKKKNAPKFLEQDITIREYLQKKLKDAGIDAIGIERTPQDLTVNILAAKPGVIIGRNGQGLEDIRKVLEKKYLQFKLKAKINVVALKQPALSAAVVAQGAAAEIEKVMAAGGQGVKISMSGRLNGAEIARREKLAAGKMSLITLRSDVDYAIAEAHTIYGKIGIKVWIYKGETFAFNDKFEKHADK